MNTVHISDVCRALWHLRNVGQRGEIFNLCDKGHTSKGTSHIITLMTSSHISPGSYLDSGF